MIGKACLATVAMAITGVPERMLLTKSMKATNLQSATLISLGFNDQSVAEKDVVTAEEAIKSHTGKYGSICFVVRRPG